MNKIKHIMNGLLGSVVMVMSVHAYAEDIEVPYTFGAGTPAYASEVNANFKELVDAVNNKLDMSTQPPVASLGYSLTPTVRGVTISNVKVNGGAITSPVEAGSTIDLTMDFNIKDPGCTGCIDQIQVGFTHLGPKGCVYSGIPGAAGVSGDGNISIIAPTEPGIYFIGVDRSQDYNCPAGWWNGAPTTSNRWIAQITVR